MNMNYSYTQTVYYTMNVFQVAVLIFGVGAMLTIKSYPYWCVTAIVFSLWGYDKLCAILGRWRISEWNLAVACFISPVAALFAMLLFRHKTQKPRFYLGVPFYAIGWTVCMLTIDFQKLFILSYTFLSANI